MAKLSISQIRDIAYSLIAENPGGILCSDIVVMIYEQNPNTPIDWIHDAVWNLDVLFPDQITQPNPGIFAPVEASESEPVLIQKVNQTGVTGEKELTSHDPFVERSGDADVTGPAALPVHAEHGGVALPPDAHRPRSLMQRLQGVAYTFIGRIFMVAGIVALMALLVVNPATSSLSTPRWEVWVVDQNAHPLQGMTVRLRWTNSLVDTIKHEDDLATDENGYVVFPARASNVSVRDRFVGIVQFLHGGALATFGPHAFVSAFGQGLEGSDNTDWAGRPAQMQSEIIAKAAR